MTRLLNEWLKEVAWVQGMVTGRPGHMWAAVAHAVCEALRSPPPSHRGGPCMAPIHSGCRGRSGAGGATAKRQGPHPVA